MARVTAGTFRALHRTRACGDPLVRPGPWDAASARVFAEAGYPALAAPSAGIAASLGYEDRSTPSMRASTPSCSGRTTRPTL
ncbi:isocitrate lyase/phosphoenolpyruvate mutase family protein [Micromonospora sp. NPDC005367]|uniref:isocitrate lyase/phosphoenolpyruvate mutase family protein n=1 Tax=Micromonospora sp. NPDC005367 TaxID=3155590 RepID=UPI0033B86594